MPTHIKDDPPVADTHDDQDPHPIHDSMVQLVRQGQDTSLRSLQVWADLARQLGLTAQSFPAGAARVSLPYNLLAKLYAAQREVVDELVATQRQLAQRFFGPTATVGDDPR
jgi:hypothetical protein